MSAGFTSGMWGAQPVIICFIKCGVVAHGIRSCTELCFPYAIGWIYILYFRSAAGSELFFLDDELRLDDGI